jgi:hypothetical protein
MHWLEHIPGGANIGHIHTVAHFDAPVERVFEVAIDV